MKNGEVSWNDEATDGYLKLQKANCFDILKLFAKFKIPIDLYNRKTNCPLPCHPSDNSPSFYYYPETNSFFCFGCKCGGSSVNFLAHMLDISKESAAEQLLSNSDISFIKTIEVNNLRERSEMILDFSNYIKALYRKNIDAGTEALYNIERTTFLFDHFYNSKKLSNNALKSLIEKIKAKFE